VVTPVTTASPEEHTLGDKVGVMTTVTTSNPPLGREVEQNQVFGSDEGVMRCVAHIMLHVEHINYTG
jgi:hypothetical protein